MTLLFASLAALLLGPPLLRLASGSPWALRLLDGFVYVAIGGLVLLHVLPEVVQVSGWGALVAAAVGLAGPSTIEKRLERSARQAHEAALLLAVVALSLHGLFDGVALSGQTGISTELGLAVVLHRLPVGLTLWWLIQPTHGTKAAAGALAAIGVATVVGFVLGGAAVGGLAAPATGLVYALVAGSLLHVVLHRPHPVAQSEGPRFGRADSALGAGLGALLLLFLYRQQHGVEEADFWGRLIDLSLESAPALLFAYAAAGVVQAFLPKATVAWLRRGRGLSQAGRGVMFGLPLPICSCGVVPVYRSLVVQGAPPAAAMAFLVATPELGLDAVLLSVPLLGPSMTVARVVAAAAVALTVGAAVGWWAERRGEASAAIPAPTPGPAAEPTFGDRAREAVRTGFGEVVDETAPWILAGLVVAAAMHPLLEAGWLQGLPDTAEVVVFALVGMPLYVCASGATPLVAVLVAGGISPGAGIALLLSGPATNVTTFGVLKDLHGRELAAAFGAAMLVACIAAGLIVNVALPGIGAAAFVVGDHAHGWLHTGALGGLVFLCLVSLVRNGPRGFFGKVLDQGLAHDDHDHDHDGHDQGQEGHGHGPDAGGASGGHAHDECC